MNLASVLIDVAHLLRIRECVCCLFLPCLLFLTGCGDNVTLPSAQELAAFERAGSIVPELDVDKLLATQAVLKRHRVSRGDLLEIRIPGRLIEADNAAASRPFEHISRVDEDGNITLPIAGSLPAADLLLPEIEAAVVAAYYPLYTAQKPTIVVRVSEHQTAQISITGAVRNPGIYDLPLHRMTVVSAIMAAGGIVEKGAVAVYVNQQDTAAPVKPQESPAAQTISTTDMLKPLSVRFSFQQLDLNGHRGNFSIKSDDKLLFSEELTVTDSAQRADVIKRIAFEHPQIPAAYVASRLGELAELIQPGTGQDSQYALNALVVDSGKGDIYRSIVAANADKPLILPVKDTNIAFADVWLQEGASVTVEPLNPEVFTVIGLVHRPGAFPYLPGARYSLIDAIGFAGGVNEMANPRYLRVYRRTSDGDIVDAAFEIRGTLPTSAASMMIKPGDVVAVEQTPRTRRNLILSQIIRFNFGVSSYYRLDDM